MQVWLLPANLQITSMLAPNCSTLLNPTRDPPVSLVPAWPCHTAHHSTPQPCCHRALAAGMAETQGGDCHLSLPGPRAGSLCAITLSCHCHPYPLPGSPKIGYLKIGSLLALQLEARKVLWSGTNPVYCSSQYSQWKQLVAVIVRKAGLTVAHVKWESLLKLPWCLQAGHRTHSSVGRTDKPAGPCSEDVHWKRGGNLAPHSWPWAEGSSIGTLSSCTQSQLFLFLFVWLTVSRRAV